MAKKKASNEKDWRSLPRKDTEPRDQRLSMRLTKSELRGIQALAKHAKMRVADYLICKALRKSVRVQRGKRQQQSED